MLGIRSKINIPILRKSWLLLGVVASLVLLSAPAYAAPKDAQSFCSSSKLSGSELKACEDGYNGKGCGSFSLKDAVACQAGQKGAAAGSTNGSAPNTTNTPKNTITEDPAAKCDNGQCDLIGRILNPTINLLAATFGAVAVISIIIGGINYTTSEGDPQKAGKAKSRITNTLIAVVAFLFLYSFLQFLVPGGIFNR